MTCNKLKHQLKQQFLSHDDLILSCYITFTSQWRLPYPVTGKQVDTAIDAFLV